MDSSCEHAFMRPSLLDDGCQVVPGVFRTPHRVCWLVGDMAPEDTLRHALFSPHPFPR